MENQQIPTPNAYVNPTPVAPQTNPLPAKTNLVMPILLTLIISGAIFGIGGYFLGKQSLPKQTANYQQTLPSPTVTKELSNSPTPTVTTDPTVDWEVFTDSKLGFSFKYPSRYTLSKSVPGGDAPKEGSYTFLCGFED